MGEILSLFLIIILKYFYFILTESHVLYTCFQNAFKFSSFIFINRREKTYNTKNPITVPVKLKITSLISIILYEKPFVKNVSRYCIVSIPRPKHNPNNSIFLMLFIFVINGIQFLME